jgi:hypothetical protein
VRCCAQISFLCSVLCSVKQSLLIFVSTSLSISLHRTCLWFLPFHLYTALNHLIGVKSYETCFSVFKTTTRFVVYMRKWMLCRNNHLLGTVRELRVLFVSTFFHPKHHFLPIFYRENKKSLNAPCLLFRFFNVIAWRFLLITNNLPHNKGPH